MYNGVVVVGYQIRIGLKIFVDIVHFYEGRLPLKIIFQKKGTFEVLLV